MSCYILSKINKKFKKMKSIKIIGSVITLCRNCGITYINEKSSDRFKVKTKAEKGCVFLSVFEAEGIDSNFIYSTPVKVKESMSSALSGLAKHN